MGRLVVVVACMLASAGCVQDHLVDCGTDLCPLGDVCDPVHGGCVLPEQLTACAELVEGATCLTTNVVGYCLDGVCVEPGCGNHVVDPGEVCDDSNATDGDGCSAACTSTEICGNGFVDLGEVCDDGNLVSHDGCDSRCGLESSTWTIDAMEPYLGSLASRTVYDPARGALVTVTRGAHAAHCATPTLLWGWRAGHWTIESLEGPKLCAQLTLTYDQARQRLVLIGTEGFEDERIDQLWELDGTTWVQHAVQNAPRIHGIQTLYDAAGDRILLSGFNTASEAEVWQLDRATWTWMQLAIPAIESYWGFGIGYDVARARVVAVASHDFDGTTFVYELVGTVWTSIAATPPASLGWQLVYDPGVAAMILVGGYDASSPPNTSTVAKWDGASWVTLAPLPDPGVAYGVVYDPVTSHRLVFTTDDTMATVIYEWDGAAWSRSAFALPPPGDVALAYDVAGDRVVRFDGTVTWIHDGAWRKLASPGPSPSTFGSGAIAYDPVREGVVWTAQGSGTWVLRGQQWTAIEAPAPAAGLNAGLMIYDPAARRMLVVGGVDYETPALFELPSAGASWQRLPETPQFTSLAFEARNGRLVGLADEESSNVCVELDGTTWRQIGSPGVGVLFAEPQRGTVQYAAPRGNMWERSGDDWRELEPLPAHVIGHPMYAPRSHETIIVGDQAGSRMLLRHGYTGAGHDETCTPAVDADGDGLAGCDDLDCWLTCHPTCPPYATCP